MNCSLRALALLVFAMPAAAQGSNTVYTVDGSTAHDLLGISVDGAGDVDRDNRADFIVGAYGANKETGTAIVYSGATGTALYTFVGDNQGDRFGCAVAGAGDVDRDGYPDVIVGAYRDDDGGTDAGSVRVFSGRNGTVLHTFHGNSAGDEFGTAVGAAGDVNRDGYADLIVGAPCDDPNGTDSGSVRVFSGRTGAVLHTFEGDSAHDWFGYAVNGAGDLNGDGYAELIVGACYDDSGTSFNNGSVRVHDGRTGAVLRTLWGVASSDWFGQSVAGLGDINNDGVPDLAVGAASNDAAGTNAGAVYVYSGRNWAQLRRFVGQRPGDEFGVSVRGCGDFDGDGRNDLVVGAFRGSTVHAVGGSVYVYSGRNGANLFTAHGAAADNRLGIAVAGAGDVTGDGRPDVVAGAVYADRLAQNGGAARVFTGTPLPLTGDPLTISLAAGGAHTLTLDGGPQVAGLDYRVVGSATSTSPGIDLGRGMILPVTYDSYSRDTIQYANGSVFENFLGRLDPRGRATARVVVPANAPPSLLGLTLYHAFFAYDDRGRVRMVSNAVTVTFTR